MWDMKCRVNWWLLMTITQNICGKKTEMKEEEEKEDVCPVSLTETKCMEHPSMI